jgi:hypothetical protein
MLLKMSIILSNMKKWPVDFYSHWKIAQFLLVAEIKGIAC